MSEPVAPTWRLALRHPGRWLDALVDGGPVYPLLILFGLNAVDELDRTAFGILLPEIQDAFGLDLQGVLTLVAVVAAGALILQVPIAQAADRYDRVRITLAGAGLWAVFSFATGLAGTVVFLAVFRSGSAIGKAVIDPTHNSLLADWYPPSVRPRVYSFHRAANAVGQFVGPLSAGLLAYWFSWRVPFLVFAVPTVLLVVAGLRLRAPVRGGHERAAMGATDEAIATEEEPPSFAESWRTVWKIPTLRRIWVSLPFLAASLIGFVSLAALLYDQEFGLNEVGRGSVAAAVEPAQLVGLIYGARIATKHMITDPGRILRFLAVISVATSGLAAVFALAPNIGVAIAANVLITAGLAVVGPGILAALSLAIPPRSRSLGFSIASLWVLPGLLVLPVIGWLGDTFGIRTGMLVLVPVLMIGGLVLSSAGTLVADDIRQVWTAAAARSEALYDRRQGNPNLLLLRGVDVAYDEVQVLFGVDLEVKEGEIVALLGTNGAGKSTLLRAVSGVAEADRGAVIFDGIDITHAPPHEIASRGVVQVPGGAGVFPGLSVAENLQVAGWLHRDDAEHVEGAIRRVHELFPVLVDRADSIAGELSGGQQQMLALGMALVSKPRLLLVDELSLGLAPIVVEQLLPVVREFRDAGVTVVLVEQSVNIALTVADRAYFMEKGEIRFDGPTAELMERPDLLRSVFLDQAVTGSSTENGSVDVRPAVPTASTAGDHPPLAVTGLSRSFGGVRAVDEVDLTVAPDEIVGVIGPNGAGKTTMFDLIGGQVRPDRGEVLLGGHDVTDWSPSARAAHGLGRSFQDPRLFASLTVAETLAVAQERFVSVRDPLRPAVRWPTAFDSEHAVDARVDDLIELFGLDAFRGKFLRELSTGSRRIVDLACLAAHRPSVVLLDEPSSGIAQRETEALVPLIRRLRDGLGAAVVVIDHDMALVAAVSDRMVAMDQGRVIAGGPCADVIADPAVVRSYLGTDAATIARSGPT